MAFWGKKNTETAPPPAPATTPQAQPVPPQAAPQPAAPPPPQAIPQPVAQPVPAQPQPVAQPVVQPAPPAAPQPAAPPQAAAIQAPPENVSAAPEGQRRQASLNSQLAPSLGKMISVLMFSPRHGSMPLGQAAVTLLPPLTANQFVVAEAHPQGKDTVAPVGLLLWAGLSDDLDQKFTNDLNTPTQLKGPDWTSGDNLWIIEAVGPPNVVDAMIKQLADGPFMGKSFKYRNRGEDGAYVVKTHGPSVPAQA